MKKFLVCGLWSVVCCLPLAGCMAYRETSPGGATRSLTSIGTGKRTLIVTTNSAAITHSEIPAAVNALGGFVGKAAAAAATAP